MFYKVHVRHDEVSSVLLQASAGELTGSVTAEYLFGDYYIYCDDHRDAVYVKLRYG